MQDAVDRRDDSFEQDEKSRSETDADRLFDEVNRDHRRNVQDLDPSEVCLFLPHCLRSRDCEGSTGEEGLRCANCGRCVIGTLLVEAEGFGLKVFCVPGGSLVEKLAKRYRPRALLGVACRKEILMALKTFDQKGVFFQVFPLERDGCFETRVDPEAVLSFLTEWKAIRNSHAGG